MTKTTVDEATLLENLAKADGSVDTEGASVLACAHFYNTKTYLRFVNNVARMSIASAMAAATGAQRMDFLNPWTDCRDLDASLATTVKYAMGLFDEGKALPERIAFSGSNSLEEMAIHWGPKGVMGVAGLLFQEAPI